MAIPIPAGQRFATGPAPVLAISNDGSQLVYSAATGSRTQLFLRPLDRFEPAAIAGTDGATAPFFSPDGRWIGYHAGEALHKVSLGGGTPLKIADVPSLAAASWGEDDTILFATAAGDGIWRVAAAGGAPVQITRPDAERNETQHSRPQLLPGGKTALIIVTIGGQSHPAVLTIATAQWQTLQQITASGGAQFVPPGHLIYAQSGGLVAMAFDAARGQLLGSPMPLLERVETPAYGASQFAVSGNGSLVYLPGQNMRPARSLMMVDRGGRATPLGTARASYTHPRLSPDGRWVAVAVQTDTGSDIWIDDLQRGTRTRLTSDGVSGFPIWTPDGKSVTYHSAALQSGDTLYARGRREQPRAAVAVADAPFRQHDRVDDPAARHVAFADRRQSAVSGVLVW